MNNPGSRAPKWIGTADDMVIADIAICELRADEMMTKLFLYVVALAAVTVVAVAPMEAFAQAEDVDEWGGLEAELAVRQAEIMQRLSAFAPSTPTGARDWQQLRREGISFCRDFERMDVLAISQFVSHGVPLWETLWDEVDVDDQGNRPEFIPMLVGLAQHCGFSRGAVYRAAFVLEYMYWNRMVDRVGMEVADALEIRDYFYELKFIATAREKIAMVRHGIPEKTRVRGDVFVADEMRLAFFLRAFGNATTLIPPSRHRAYMAQIEILDIRRESMMMFTSDILALVDNDDDLEVMNEFYDYLVLLQEERHRLGEAHGGWHALVDLCDGDHRQAIRVLGLLAHLRGWILEEVSEALIRRGELTPEVLRAFYAGANAYFMMNQHDERSALNGDDPYTLRYHFFYPPGYESRDWKTYHWYANAHVGCELEAQGLSQDGAEVATRRLAQAYEALTLNLAIPTKQAMDEEPRARAIVEGWEDVDLNAEGGYWGWQLCAQ